MKSVLDLHIDNNSMRPKYELSEGFEFNSYRFIIELSKEVPFVTLLNSAELKKKINDMKDFYIFYEPNEESFGSLDKSYNVHNNLIEDIDYVQLTGNLQDIKDYINKNKGLKNYKIVINRYIKLDLGELERIKKEFNDFSNIHIYLDGNINPVSLEEAEKTINIVNSIVEKVKSHNFSPIESIMYVYDIVRGNVYNIENDDESPRKSMDLTPVLLEKKITCEGYHNLFSIILSKLDICAHRLELKSKDLENHVRSIIYVEDEKYGIKGLYQFDPTWDCKDAENDNRYLISYKYFAKTIDEMIDYNDDLIDITLGNVDEKLLDICSVQILKYGFDKLPRNVVKRIEKLFKYIEKKESLKHYSNNEIVYRLNEYKRFLNNPIPANVYLRIFINVRKHEYYENSENYEFNEQNIFKTALNSNWVYFNNMYDVMRRNAGIEISRQELLEKVNAYIQDKDLEKQIAQVKLVRTLKKITEEK